MSVADFAGLQPGCYTAELDERALRKGVRPIASADGLRPALFESDQELDDFLAGLEEFRHDHVA